MIFRIMKYYYRKCIRYYILFHRVKIYLFLADFLVWTCRVNIVFCSQNVVVTIFWIIVLIHLLKTKDYCDVELGGESSKLFFVLYNFCVNLLQSPVLVVTMTSKTGLDPTPYSHDSDASHPIIAHKRSLQGAFRHFPHIDHLHSDCFRHWETVCHSHNNKQERQAEPMLCQAGIGLASE